jgi:hypothetical protein
MEQGVRSSVEDVNVDDLQPILAQADRVPSDPNLLNLTPTLAQIGLMPERRRGQVFQFQTIVECQPRTVGTIFLIPESTRLEDWDEADAQTLGRMHELPPETRATARGKVVLLEGDARGRVFQVRQRQATVVACGNATAAAAAVIAHTDGPSSVSFLVDAPGVIARVTARVVGTPTWRCVEQDWEVDAEPILSFVDLAGEQVPWVRFLNDYLILKTSSLLTPEEVLRFAEHDLKIPGLRAKVAVVHPGAPPFLRFYGCNGLHGAAPLTGLSTVALAAARLPWLGALTECGVIRHPGGSDRLPKVMPTEGRTVIDFGAVDVRLL